MQIVFGLPDVGASARQLEGNADRDARGRRRHGPGAREFAAQSVRRQIQEQAEGVDLLRRLLFEARDLRSHRLELRLGVLDVEPCRQSLLLERLRQIQETLFGFHVFIGDVDQGLGAAQLDVVVCHLRQRGDEGRAPLVLGSYDLSIGGFDLSADVAPEIQFPRGVESGGVVVERRDRRRVGDQAFYPVLAKEFPLVFPRPVHGRQFRRSGDASLSAAFRDLHRCGQHVEIGGGDALFQPGQDGIAKHLPPHRIRRLRCGGARRRALVGGRQSGVREFGRRQAGIRGNKIGANVATRNRRRSHGNGDNTCTNRHNTPPPPLARWLVLDRVRPGPVCGPLARQKFQYVAEPHASQASAR